MVFYFVYLFFFLGVTLVSDALASDGAVVSVAAVVASDELVSSATSVFFPSETGDGIIVVT